MVWLLKVDLKVLTGLLHREASQCCMLLPPSEGECVHQSDPVGEKCNSCTVVTLAGWLTLVCKCLTLCLTLGKTKEENKKENKRTYVHGYLVCFSRNNKLFKGDGDTWFLYTWFFIFIFGNWTHLKYIRLLSKVSITHKPHRQGETVKA